MGNRRLRLAITTIAIIVVVLAVGVYLAFPQRSQLMPGSAEANTNPGSSLLTISLDKQTYQVGDNATVTFVLKNSGQQALVFSNLQVTIMVYAPNGAFVGSWAPLYAPLHKAETYDNITITVRPGETKQWSLRWNLSIQDSITGTLQQLATGSYGLQARLSLMSEGAAQPLTLTLTSSQLSVNIS